MEVDNPNLDEDNVMNDSVHTSPQKIVDHKDVGPDVETSLDQLNRQDESVVTPVRDQSGFRNAYEKEISSDDTAVNSLSLKKRNNLEKNLILKRSNLMKRKRKRMW